ncbi:MAG TPA: efflux RND transporter periplasmic adaptor subunit [Terracidiphilus sp.]|nr:efflux RND transporter periplasmic adaptor subunit [Terracidiphilus sp.]
MSIEGTSESQHSDNGASGNHEEPHAHKNPWVRIIVYLVLVCGVGFVAWRIYQNQQAAAAKTERQATALMSRPVPVQVVPVTQEPMPIFLTALGTVTPNMSVTVKARVSGQLLPVRFTEGQEVKQGQTIMVIDPRPYQAALDQAKGTLAHDEALLKNAQAEYARYKALYAAGVTSKETMQADEAAQGQYEGAIVSDKAAIEAAQLQLNWCYIQSPIDGKIGLRLVDPGNIITANTTNLVIINQIRPIAVYFTLPENQLPPVLQKLRADRRLVAEAYDKSDLQKLATGQLLTVDNQIDTTTGTAKFKALFNNENEVLFPNQFVNIHLVTEERTNALVVPSAAIQSGLQGSFVWTVNTDDKGATTAKMQPVKVALAQGQVTILDSGIARGENVVVDGAERLREGAPVVVSQSRQKAGGKSAGTGNGTGQSGAAGNSAAAANGQASGKHPHNKEQQ